MKAAHEGKKKKTPLPVYENDPDLLHCGAHSAH